MIFDKVATFQNNKKKDWFSHKTRLVFLHGDVLKDESLMNLRWSSLQKLVMVGYLHVAMVTQSSLQTKLKLDENVHALKVTSDTIPCFVDMFLNVLKTPITFCFINILLHFEN